MQQEHKARDTVFSSMYDAWGYKTAYIKQTILPLSDQIPATVFAITNHCCATTVIAGGQSPWDQTTWQVALTQRRLVDFRPLFPKRWELWKCLKYWKILFFTKHRDGVNWSWHHSPHCLGNLRNSPQQDISGRKQETFFRNTFQY